jgi:hypothetical protein
MRAALPMATCLHPKCRGHLPRHRSKAFPGDQLNALFLGSRKDRCGQGMLACLFETGCRLQQLSIFHAFNRNQLCQLGLSQRQRAALVDTKGIDLLQELSASASLMRTPSPAPLPEPTIIAIGVARPSAYGHAIFNTAAALTNA